MPTYEYQCTACEKRLEVEQRFSDDPLTECPSCGGELRKVYSPVGVVFKGSGFYKTDSRSSSSTAKESGAAPSKESTSSSDASSTSSSPASTPASTPSTPAASASSSDS